MAITIDARGQGHDLTAFVFYDEPIRSLFRRTMEEAGWEVAEAENGAVALQRVAERQPDLILLDLMMPVMDGFEFVLELRQPKIGHEIPIIVITAKDLT